MLGIGGAAPAVAGWLSQALHALRSAAGVAWTVSLPALSTMSFPVSTTRTGVARGTALDPLMGSGAVRVQV
ncbi:MAG TPA: hypothetical protein VFH51_20230, partial [Myxococcota bacterium]|nr:hypothetical protein [Myxococcota bacterium]